MEDRSTTIQSCGRICFLYVIERVGKDQILYARDYTLEPDLDEVTQEVEARKDRLDIAKRKILSDNGRRFYKMEV